MSGLSPIKARKLIKIIKRFGLLRSILHDIKLSPEDFEKLK